MTSACNIIYNGANAIADDLNVNYPLYGASCTVSGAMSAAGLINSNTGFAQNNVEILDVTANGGATDINISLGHSNIPNAATGFGNIGVGFQAGNAITSGIDNVFIGDRAGKATTTGGNNVAIGPTALLANTTGVLNVAIGSGSCASQTTVGGNIGVGPNALTLNTVAPNIAIGSNSRANSVTGVHNIAIGSGAQYNASVANTGGFNVNIGTNSGAACTSGSGNVAIGFSSMLAATTASDNVVIGVNCADDLTTGTGNIIIGSTSVSLAPNSLTTGSNNIVIGSSAVTAASSNSNSILITTTPAITGAGSNTTVIDPNCVATGAASSHILGYNSTTGQVFKSTTVTPALTVTGGLTAPASVAYAVSGFAATPSGVGSVTNNDRVGYATYTGLADTAAGNSIVLTLVNNLIVGAGTRFQISVIDQSVAATACFSYKSINSLIAGQLSFVICNVGAATSGAAGSVTIQYQILN